MVVRSPRHAVFFSGDTGLTTEYATIRERLGPFDLVMLEVGASSSVVGRHSPRARQRARSGSLLSGGPFLPVLMGTFALAHARLGSASGSAADASVRQRRATADAPASASRSSPQHGHRLAPWWREVDAAAVRKRSGTRRPMIAYLRTVAAGRLD